MDWLLTLLAAFNVVSMYSVFSSRVSPRKNVPWITFGTALMATELAWIWLPLQALLAWLLSLGGATESGLGSLAMLILVISWSGLAWSIWQSTLAEEAIESALQEGLGYGYRNEIPPQRSGELFGNVQFRRIPKTHRRARIDQCIKVQILFFHEQFQKQLVQPRIHVPVDKT